MVMNVVRLSPTRDAQKVRNWLDSHGYDASQLWPLSCRLDYWYGGYVGDELRAVYFAISAGFPGKYQMHIYTAKNFRCKYLLRFVEECVHTLCNQARVKMLGAALHPEHYNWILRMLLRLGFTHERENNISLMVRFVEQERNAA